MQKYASNVQQTNGDALTGASVTVYTDSAHTTKATIYSDNGITQTTNPLTTDSDGEFSFYAADGRYYLGVSKTGITTQYLDDVLLFDPTASTGATSVVATVPGSGTSSTAQALLNSRPYILAASAAGVAAGADITEDILATITVPANAMGANGLIRITLMWTTTNNANSKTFRCRFSGASGTDFLGHTSSSVSAVSHIVTIANRNATNSQVGMRATWSTANAALIGAHVTGAIDTTPLTTVVITGQKASSGDTLKLESYLAELFYGA